MKVWLLTKLIKLCDYALKYSDAADDQSEINEVVKNRNYFIKELNKCKGK